MTPPSETYNIRYVWFICGVAALGGLLFGYDWAVIGGAKPFFDSFFRLDSARLVGWANSCALVGCLIGSVASGTLSERWGRRKLLILAGFLFAVSSVMTGWAFVFSWFVAWRILGGVAIGMASNVSPMYIAEVSPAAWRGRLVSLNQLAIVIGVLAAQIMNWRIAQPVPDDIGAELLRQSWNVQFGWRWMFSAVAAPSLVMFAAAWLVPESPRWLVKNGRRGAARAILERIGGEAYGLRGIAEIEATVRTESLARVSWAEVFAPRVRKIVGIGIALAVLQQWSGINVIFNYAEDIYRGAGYGVSGVLFNIVITGTINMLFTFVALGFVDRYGRRVLMLAGAGGIAASHALLGLGYYLGLKGLPVLLLTLSTIGCYAMSLAPVTWVLISEIFPNRIRGLAVSVSVSALWVACFLLTFTFPLLNAALGPAGTFWLYAAICVAGFLFIRAFVPETKGKTLERIESELNPGTDGTFSN